MPFTVELSHIFSLYPMIFQSQSFVSSHLIYPVFWTVPWRHFAHVFNWLAISWPSPFLTHCQDLAPNPGLWIQARWSPFHGPNFYHHSCKDSPCDNNGFPSSIFFLCLLALSFKYTKLFLHYLIRISCVSCYVIENNMFSFFVCPIALDALYILILIWNIWLLLDHTLIEARISILLKRSTVVPADRQLLNKKEDEEGEAY